MGTEPEDESDRTRDQPEEQRELAHVCLLFEVRMSSHLRARLSGALYMKLNRSPVQRSRV
jgi:hypothetical protein